MVSNGSSTINIFKNRQEKYENKLRVEENIIEYRATEEGDIEGYTIFKD